MLWPHDYLWTELWKIAVDLVAVHKTLQCSLSMDFLEMDQDGVTSESGMPCDARSAQAWGIGLAMLLSYCLRYSLDVAFLTSNKNNKWDSAVDNRPHSPSCLFSGFLVQRVKDEDVGFFISCTLGMRQSFNKQLQTLRTEQQNKLPTLPELPF